MPNQPWRDIPPGNSILQSLDQSVRRESVIRNYIHQINAYHQQPKDDLKTLAAREFALRQIASAGKSIVINNRRVRRSPASSNVIVKTADQASLKAGYVHALWKLYWGAGHKYLEPQALINYLASPPHAAGGELASLQSGCRFEQLDPAHRSFEFHFKQNTAFGSIDFQTPMTWAFGEWLGIITKDHGHDPGIEGTYPKKDMTMSDVNTTGMKPFFLWLETHVISVGPDGATFNSPNAADQFFKGPEAVSGVLYSQYGSPRTQKDRISKVGGIHWILPSSDGTVVEMPLDDPKGGTRRFDTLHLPGKPPHEQRSAAYVWTTCGTVLAGQHETGVFHHSSFVGGKDVRCAGMMQVEDGKINRVSNDSGHYRPSVDNLREFVRWLYARKVFTTSGQVRFFNTATNGYAVQDVEEFLGIQVGNGGRVNRPNRVVSDALDRLNGHMRTAAENYKNTYIDPRTGRRFIFRRQSRTSKAVEAYLLNDFPKDIDEAKKNTSEYQWWSIPGEIIKSLLGEAGAKSLGQIAQQSNALSPLIGNKKAMFSSSPARLSPLKRSSTMHSILSAEFRKWREPETTNSPTTPTSRLSNTTR